jgi:hypothetical protein
MRLGPSLLVSLLAALASGCETPSATDAGSSDGSSTPEALALAADAAVPPPPEQLPVPDEPDPGALEEIVQATPEKQPPTTGPKGTTLIGTDTEVERPERDGAEPALPPAPTGRLQAGEPEIPHISNPAMERAAREQYYWPIVQKCRGPDGEILLPESIDLRFTIRHDGPVDPASVTAGATDPRYTRAAECAVREFSALGFTSPQATVGQSIRVNGDRVIATLPSVD